VGGEGKKYSSWRSERKERGDEKTRGGGSVENWKGEKKKGIWGREEVLKGKNLRRATSEGGDFRKKKGKTEVGGFSKSEKKGLSTRELGLFVVVGGKSGLALGKRERDRELRSSDNKALLWKHAKSLGGGGGKEKVGGKKEENLKLAN